MLISLDFSYVLLRRLRTAWTLLTLIFGVLVSFTALAAEDPWLDIPQDQLVYLQLEQGTVVLQLAPQFAPKNTARFVQLVKTGFYNGLQFYRVIDQFVLQAGLPEEESHPRGLARVVDTVAAEFSWAIRPQDPFTLVQQADLLAAQTGFNQGFAVGREQGQEWLLHCPNVVNMARDTAADSATADFAIMQGQAPRHLDRNMSIFARVVWGRQWLNLVQRGDATALADLVEHNKRSTIVSAQLGSDLAPAMQLPLQMMNTQSAAFTQKLAQSRQRANDFFQYKGQGKLDICYQQVPMRLKIAADNAQP